MLHFTDQQLLQWTAAVLWPFLRIGAMLLAAPLFGARTVPVRVRVALALVLALTIAPVVPQPPPVDPLGPVALVVGAQQVLLGLVMGFTVQLVFAALVLGGQSIAMSMGLGFASMVDPQNGVQVPVVSQYYVILATLVFVALNGHLALIELLVQSFRTLPVGAVGLDRDGLWQLAGWGTHVFAGAVLMALPAMAALLLVNLAFGVMTRAAPQLNLFAVGFPVTLLTGFVVMLFTLPALTAQFERLLGDAFGFLRAMTGGA